MRPAGYLIHREPQQRGIYEYVMAGNGLFVQSSSELIVARVQIADVKIRGLEHLEPKVILTHGKIPRVLFDLAKNAFLADPDVERYLAFIWQEDGYHLWSPNQTVSEISIQYEMMENVVLDLHSHGRMEARFSSQDDIDEQGFRIYGVAGNLRSEPAVRFRVGIYGYFGEISFLDVFE